MIVSLVLFVVLGLVLLGAAAALTRRKLGSSSGQARTAGPGADRKVLETVALGLQVLAEGRVRDARRLPEVQSVVHSGQRLTVQLAQADAAAPAPWTSDVSGKEWSLDPASLRAAGTSGGGPTHPYSLTVTLGLHRGDRVLVDLAQLPGPIALTGDDHEVLRLAQALITEVVSGPVGHLATVVLVGSATTPPVTDGLGTRSARLYPAATRKEALAHKEAPADKDSGRSAGASRRLFVVTAAQFRDERWADAPLRETDALLVLGWITDAEWHIAVHTDGSLDTGRLGVPVDTHTARFS
ncbi:hypothetical protein C6Y14_38735 [Streptomyces dioscori]|uniref:Uncharacterized protein n=1 Tax=Streptomyces dioscori TaxID=2109333 RepID=A0A2P8PVN4_9ACTN|nr:hypothetical protein [Streptomyces dioscori]PSM38027.1 hypothetical protein C6Y14_38735 [Streptomyces dioscori]